MRLLTVSVLVVWLVGCRGENSEPAPQPPGLDSARPQPEMRAVEDVDEEAADSANASIIGVVNVLGSDPSPQVVLAIGEGDAESEQVALVGALREELARLSGVEVRIVGSEAMNPHGTSELALDVVEYDVVSVNGTPAYLGTLEYRNGDLWLVRDPAFRLTAVPDGLADLDGAKVWVAGPVEGDELRVQSFGIVREH